MKNKEVTVAKRFKVSAKTLDKAKDRIVTAYISDAQRITAGAGMSLQFLKALTRAMGYKAIAAQSDDYFYIR